MQPDDSTQTRRPVSKRADTLRVLGDPIRLGVVDLLTLGDMSPDSLGDRLDVKGNLLAHHLKILSDAGIITRVESHHDRRRKYVHLLDSALEELLPTAPQSAADRVVFVCTHNSARSVMAEALWSQTSNIPCASAGTQPAAHYHPQALATLNRAGVLPPATEPRHLHDVLRPQDTIVTVCDAVHEELDDLPPSHIHWSIDDPAENGTQQAFQSTFDDLTTRVTKLADAIHPPRKRTS